MTLYFRTDCTCGRYWAYGDCPVHGSRGYTYTTTANPAQPCKGRHCAHDWHCFAASRQYVARWTCG